MELDESVVWRLLRWYFASMLWVVWGAFPHTFFIPERDLHRSARESYRVIEDQMIPVIL